MNGLLNRAGSPTLSLQRKFVSSSAAAAALNGNPATEHRRRMEPLRFLCPRTNSGGLMRPNTESIHGADLERTEFGCDVGVDTESECAYKVFDGIPKGNSSDWNMVISGCNRSLRFDGSWRVFCRMHKSGVAMDGFTYSSVFTACRFSEGLVCGEQVYGLVVKNGLDSNGYVRSGMIDLLARGCRFSDALKMLNDDPCDNVVCWNGVVSGAVKGKEYRVALRVFDEMRGCDIVRPDAFTYWKVLNAAVVLEEIGYGKGVHGLVIKAGAGDDVFVGNAVVDLYTKSGYLRDALNQFDEMPIHNAVSWASVIHGFVQKGDLSSAVRAFNKMLRIGECLDEFAVSRMIAACGDSVMFKEVLQIHCWIVKTGFYLDPVVKAPLINAYSKMGAIGLSESVFEEGLDLKQFGIWANMISAYVHAGMYDKAITFFHRMIVEGVTPDKLITCSVLSIIDDLTLGRLVHGYTIKLGLASEVSVGSSIFTMYSRCDDLDESLKAFEELERKDIVSWTSMIAGFVDHGFAKKGIQLFREMWHKNLAIDDKILAVVINACSALSLLKLGRVLHGFSLQSGFRERIAINEQLVNMYSKCGDLGSAMSVFGMMFVRDQTTWSSIISGFSRRGHIDEALQLLKTMLLSNLSIDDFSMSSVVRVLNDLRIGTHLHSYIVKRGLESYCAVGSSLIMMYSRIGSINNSVEVFLQIQDPDLISWTAMIESFAYHGRGREALWLFDLMKECGIKPDAETFVGVLSACSHAGLVEEGYIHLNSMIRDYAIEPSYKHYACMVDLLGRAGRLDEAERFISKMPIDPDTLVWETLLAACKVHGNHELGKLAARKILELQPPGAAAYVSVSNIWAEAGDWDRVMETRGLMKETGLERTEPGWSYVSDECFSFWRTDNKCLSSNYIRLV